MLVGLRSEILKFKIVAEKAFAVHCLSGLFVLRFHLLEYVAEDLERSGSLCFTDAALFEHFEVTK